MNKLNTSPTDYIEFQQTNEKAQGFALTIAGVAFAAVGIEGIDSHEARTPEDALASITLDDAEAFITTPDLGFGAVLGVGLALGAVGLSKLFSRNQPKN